jgi:energy-converting hydrogenase Eha subunit A
MALGLAWFGTSLGTGVLGWLVGGLPGRMLVSVSVLGFAATGAVVSNRRRRVTLTFSALASAVVIAIGVAAVLVAIIGDVGVDVALALGAVPIVGGVLSRRLSRRAWRMAQ